MSDCVTSVYLLRHGECQGGVIFRGQTDSPLTSAGAALMRQQLSTLSQSSVSNLVTSPAQRCAQPARQWAQQQGIACHTLNAFAEINFGEWEGRTVDDVAHTEPELLEQFLRDPASFTPPKAETLLAFQRRVVGAWTEMLSHYKGQAIVVVTHGGVIRLILAHILGMPLRPLSHLQVPHGCLSLVSLHHADNRADWPQLVFHNRSAPHVE